jgi:D-tyrosyl-tRNA(Tyr) deacylase
VKAVVQRVARASVVVDGETVGAIGNGLLVLLGVGHHDGTAEARALVDKMLGLRIFPDASGKMNRSVVDTGGSVLVVSQFTLLADIRKGRRPSFTDAAVPDAAAAMIDEVVGLIQQRGVEVATGRFGAMMEIELLNSGPVTIVIDAEDGRIQ